MGLSLNSEAANLPEAAQAGGQKLATIKEFSNDRAGYKVSLSTANGAKLKDSATGETYAYRLSYGGIQLDFGSGSAIISDAAGATSESGVAKELRISCDASSLQSASAEDTIVITVAAR